MTKVLIRLNMPEVYGQDIPALGKVELRPTVRVNVPNEGVMLPAPTSVTLRDGRAEVDLLPNEAGIWAWMADEKVPGGKMRWVNVPEDTGVIITYEDLVDVDPTSLSPSDPETIEAWRQIKAQVDQNTADIEELQQTGGGGSGGDGSLWWTGTAVPDPALGTTNDFYLRSNGDVYKKTNSTTWALTGTNLKGPQGQQGNPGSAGTNGQSPELRVSGGYIQWKYPTQQTWTNLVALTAITGPSGNDGTDGTNGSDGTDGTNGKGWTGGSYSAATGQVTFASEDGLGFVTGDLRGADGTDGARGTDGADGVGIQSVTDNLDGTMTVLLTNGTSSVIDLPEGPEGPRGLQGIQGNPGTDGTDGTDGADGLGWTGGSYNPATGIATFTSDDGLGFATGDLRGADGADGTDGAQGDPGPGIPIVSGSPVTPTGEWFGSQAEYDAITTPVTGVIYNILASA